MSGDEQIRLTFHGPTIAAIYAAMRLELARATPEPEPADDGPSWSFDPVRDDAEAWRRLVEELATMRAWSSRPTANYRPAWSAYIGVEEDGRFYAGAHVDGDQWPDDSESTTEELTAIAADTAPAAIEQLIAAMARYRERVDREQAELEADYLAQAAALAEE